PRSRVQEGTAVRLEGAARQGATDGPPRILPSIPAVVAADGAEARKGAAWFVAFYLASMGPFSPRIISRLGFEREVQAVAAANTTRGAAGGAAGGGGVLEGGSLGGTPGEGPAGAAAWG